MSTPPLPPSPSKKPSALASCILLGLILGAVGAVGGGGWWAWKTFVKKSPAEAAPAASAPRPPDPGLAVVTPPSAETVPPEPMIPVPQPVAVPPAVTPAPDPVASVDSPPPPMPNEPATTPDPVPPPPSPVVPPDAVAATGVPSVSSDVADPDPVVQEEPVESFAESAPEVALLKTEADRRIEEAPPEIYSDDDKQKVREAIRVAKRLSRVATLQFGKGSDKLGNRETARFKKALLTPEAENLLSDPQAVLFVIGYADATGTSRINRQISQARATGVEEVLKSFKIPNKCYSVGIGSTSLISAEQQSKNRAVEVWIVLP